MSLEDRVSRVVQCLELNGLSTATFIRAVLWSRDVEHADAQDMLTTNAAQICEHLCNHENSHSSVMSWASALVHNELCQEVTELSLEKHGLHFKATAATAEQLETVLMDQLAATMQAIAPGLWNLVLMLLDSSARNGRRRVSAPTQISVQGEMDLGEFGGDELDQGQDDDSEDSESSGEGGVSDKRPRKRQRRAASRNVALLTIVSSLYPYYMSEH